VRRELAAFAGAVDLLVCGSRSWGPIRRVVLGSTSDWLIPHVSCPVLVVPRSAVAHEGSAVAGTAASQG
jgi:nucleotide-binding universal stress UspA family protein